ncbi:phage tail spike protein [Neobacillus sp. M.A.Huq-85]
MLFVLNRHEVVEAILDNNDAPGACPYYEDLMIEDLSTGASSYEFKVPSYHPSTEFLIGGNFIVRKNLDNKLVMFQIMQVEDAHGGENSIYVYAETAGLELLNDIVRPGTWDTKSVDQILDIVLQDTRWQRGETEYFGVDNFTFDAYYNVLDRLNFVADKFNAEISFRVKMKNGEIVGRYVDIVQQRGEDTKKRFEYGKDIQNIRRTVDLSSVVTALIGVGKGQNNSSTTFKSISRSISNGDKFSKPFNQDWVGDPDALQQFGIKGKHIFGVYEYETTNADTLLDKTWAQLQKQKNPLVTYEVDVSLLERLVGIQHEAVRIGDSVYVIDTTFSPPLYLDSRVSRLETSFTDPKKDKCVLANFKVAKSNITKQMRDIQSKLLQKESTWDSSLFTWIMYADDEIGTGITNDPTGKQYIGLSYNNVIQDPSMDPSVYSWARITGEGIQGPAGTTYYTWVKYADDAAGTNLSDSPTGKKYLGLAYNKISATESTNAADYTWSLILGPQGPQGVQGSQGIQGPAGPQGQATYVWIKYADDTNGTGMSDSPTGKKYMGIAYNKTTATKSTVATDYQWSLYVGSDGVQGPPGANGQPTYTWIKYADSITGTGMSDDPTNKKYLGIAYNKTTATESTTATDYSWSLIQGPQGDTGPQGPQGNQGIPGPTGPQGQSLYTWVKYADSSTGTGLSDDPTGKKYIGFAYNKTTATESSIASDYTWSLIEGPQGVQGPNGVTYYTWLKYADDANGTNMTDTPTGKKYMGIAYNKSTSVESTVATDYSWSLIQGPQGVTGPQGPIGATGPQGPQGISGTDAKYVVLSGPLVFKYAAGAGAPTNTTVALTATAYNITSPTYQWQYWNGTAWTNLTKAGNTSASYTVAYNDTEWSTNTSMRYRCLVSGSYSDEVTLVKVYDGTAGGTGPQGNPGANALTLILTNSAHTVPTDSAGANGVYTGSGTDLYLYEGTTALTYDGVGTSNGTWKATAAGTNITPGAITTGTSPNRGVAAVASAMTADTASIIFTITGKRADGTAISLTQTQTFSKSKTGSQGATGSTGPQGPTGPQGIAGPKGADGVTYYTWIKYADSPTSGMTDTPTGKTYMGIAYNKTTATESTTYSDYSWSLIQGPQGIQGPTGPNGQTTYTWVKYADDASGAGMNDSPTGKRWLGLAFNKTTATESTTATDYSWSPLYDNVQVGGRNLFLGSGSAVVGGLSYAAGSNAEYQTLDIKNAWKDNCVSGDTVTISFDVVMAKGNYLQIYNSNNAGPFTFTSKSFSNIGTTKKRLAFTTTLQSRASPTKTNDTIEFYSTYGTSDWFKITNVKLEKGNIATDWSQAPEDLVQQNTDYNGVNFSSANGMVVTSAKNKLTLNAIKGIEILRTSDNKVMFNADASTGNVTFAGDITGASGTFSGNIDAATITGSSVTIDSYQDADTTNTVKLEGPGLNAYSFYLNPTTRKTTVRNALVQQGLFWTKYTFGGVLYNEMLQDDFSIRFNNYGGSNANLASSAMWFNGTTGINFGSSNSPSLSPGLFDVTFSMDDKKINAYKTLDMNNTNIEGINHLVFEDPGAAEGIEWAGGNGWVISESTDAKANGAGNLMFWTGGTYNSTTGLYGSTTNLSKVAALTPGGQLQLVSAGGSLLKFTGTTHTYQEFYIDTTRYGWFGYGSAGSTTFQMRNEQGPIVIQAKTVNDDVSIVGQLKASNLAAGQVTVTPVANAVKSIAISFGKTFEVAPIISVAANSTVPYSEVRMVSFSNVTTTGCTLNIYRTNTTATELHWIAYDPT